MVEDNPADVDLTRECLVDGTAHVRLHVAVDGLQALEFLRKSYAEGTVPRPDLILLDLNIPKRDGREVLAEIKGDPGLKRIPVIILTSSGAAEDVTTCYELHANCFLQKPLNLKGFTELTRAFDEFWLTLVRLPPTEP